MCLNLFFLILYGDLIKNLTFGKCEFYKFTQMIFKRFIWLALSITGIQTAHSQYTDVINSNRPGESFGAFAVGKTVFQTEGGLSYINEKYNNSDTEISGMFVDLDIRYGFSLEELELVVDLQYRNDTYTVDEESTNRSNLRHSIVGFKYLVYDPFKNYEEKLSLSSWKYNHRFRWRQFLPAVAVYAGANVNFSNNPYIPEELSKITPKGMIILQNHFSGGWVFVTNILADNIATDFMTFGGIFTTTKSFNERWSGFAEFQGYKSDHYNDIIVRGGAAYLLGENIQLDVSIGKNFRNSTDVIYGGLGVSWRSTIKYKDIKIFKDDGIKK